MRKSIVILLSLVIVVIAGLVGIGVITANPPSLRVGATLKDPRSYFMAAQQRFVLGDHEGAFDGFKSIYMERCDFRDVAQIVHDYYDMAKEDWIAKYKTRFRGPHEAA